MMRLMQRRLFLLLIVLFVCRFAFAQASADRPTLMPVGVAKVDATPKTPVVLAGYGSRSDVYQGIDAQLWARALVIGAEHPLAIVVLDNCGVPRSSVERLAQMLTRHGIRPDHLIVAATHTHSAPALVDYAPILWQGRTTAEQDRGMVEYTTYAIQQMKRAVIQALEAREPMSLEWSRGRVGFGVNRRVLNTAGRWQTFGAQRSGPVDHSLPILAARDADGRVRAVWANYACHCTTVGGRNFVGGDWAGFANSSIEKDFPGAISLMTIGCGADVGPQPSGDLTIARRHGESIAGEVKRQLADRPHPLSEAPTVVSRRIRLPLSKPQSRAYWESQLKGDNWHRELARFLLAEIDKNGSIPDEVEYPIAIWKFGTELAIVFLAGEVVVDYSVRLNAELDWRRLWITAWANDMPGYIPSRRVLLEGGYEAGFSQVYYGKHGPYDVRVEDILVGAVQQLAGPEFAAVADQPAAPFHRLPSREPSAFRQLAQWAVSAKPDSQTRLQKRLTAYLDRARPALERLTDKRGERTEWYSFSGDIAERYFIRQQARDVKLEWLSPPIADNSPKPYVMCFSGGLGWESQPQTAGFELSVNGSSRLKFDITRRLSRWMSDDETLALIYLPMWTSSVDSGGFFFVVWRPADDPREERVRFSVRSLGTGSLRWFAIDAKQNTPARLQKLRKALSAP